MGRALLSVAVAAATCVFVLWLIAPRLLRPAAPGPPSAAAPSDSAAPAPSAASAAASLPPTTGANAPPGLNALPALAPLQTPEQKAAQEYETQRAPFYAFLRDRCGALIADGRPSDQDSALLVLYAARNNDHAVGDMLGQIVTPYAYAYGFRHVRFYLPAPPGSVERYRLAAEAQATAPDNWQAFQK